VLDASYLDAEFVSADIGWEFWKSEGDPLPDRTVETMKQCDCALFAAITSKPKEEAERELVPELQGKGLAYRSTIVRMRQLLDLYVNLRPCKAFKGNPLNFRDDLDFVVFRENTEGLYAGVEYHPLPADVRQTLESSSSGMAKFQDVDSADLAVSCRIFTRAGCQRIVRQAFEYAKEHGYPTVTLVEKPNVIRETSGLMVREARKIAADYPGIDLWETNVDAMAMWLVKNPQDYGVIVSSNMFGDIVSDLCAQLVGGLGFAASGNIGESLAVFEPTHGSAPKYAGKYVANPTAMLLAVKLMLGWLGERELATRLQSAIAAVIEEGKVRTYDLGGSDGTLDVAREVARKLS